jgi:hypothetical protein
MISRILSILFPPTEPIYHTYRRETKKIPVLTPSQAWAYYLHMRKGISTFGMSAAQIYDELPTTYLRRFEFRNTLLPGGSK